MHVETSPWPHIIVDDYYQNDLFESMRDEIIAFVKTSRLTTKQTFFRSYENDFQTRFPKTYECARSVPAIDNLNKFEQHRPFRKLSLYHEINVILDGHSYPIHDENPRKILSIVNYIAPELSTGTLIYDQDKNFIKEVEWKPNRTLVFAGITDVTWHSYEVRPKQPRITLNTFLVDDDMD